MGKIKYCSKCDLTKSIEMFAVRSDANHLLRSHCKKCNSKYGVVLQRIRKNQKPRTKMPEEQRKINNASSSKKHRMTDAYKVKHAIRSANRRASQLQATPKWLTEYQKQGIALNYELARIITKELRLQMDVDHIIPLKGKNVCGLHVPWNLQIMCRSGNAQKKNNYEQD